MKTSRKYYPDHLIDATEKAIRPSIDNVVIPVSLVEPTTDHPADCPACQTIQDVGQPK